jgi:glycosyltransferase involved in cell wall biosynthesis
LQPGFPTTHPTVGFYSPLPPAPTGVADYAQTLLAGLRRHGRVQVAPSRCDVALYHLGNNRLHAAIYQRALSQPGIVVLHDAVLHHFLLGQLSREAYIDEFCYNYGEWQRGLAEELWRGRAASGSDSRYFAYPMLRRIAEAARAVVVHNPAAARRVREHAPKARVVELPHLALTPGPEGAPSPSEAEILRYRQRLGVHPAAFLFGVFGYLRESKRLMSVLSALASARREVPRAALLVAGGFVSSDLQRAAAPLLSAPGVFRLPYLNERDFQMAAGAVDACINLRHPAAGETSGIAIRLMGLGKPVLVTEGEETARLPEDACIRIPAGIAERASLRQHVILLTLVTEAARAIGQRGARHIQAHHAVEEVSKQYWKLICESCT